MLKLIIAIFVGKIILFFTKTLKFGGGSTAPGFYALKIDPCSIEELSEFLPLSIIITGTNGKTTTSKLISYFCEQSGLRVIRNRSGSNLERGVLSALIEQIPFNNFLNPSSIRKSFDLCIWEIDEAAFYQISPKINSLAILFLNIFRDQLDRYGEINSIISKWNQTLTKISQKSKIVINSDDTNLLQILKNIQTQPVSFSITGEKIKGESRIKGKKYKSQATATNIQLLSLDQTKFDLIIGLKTLHITSPLPGLYNIYNLTAALTLADILNLDLTKVNIWLESFSPAFGRVEKFTWKDKKFYLLLIKNPAGATEVLKLIKSYITPHDQLMIALNDKFADGQDVSWIWDADFEKLNDLKLKYKFVLSGIRAYDLAVRLKYSGIEENHLIVEPDLIDAFNALIKSDSERVFILPTYTALLSIQKILTQKKIKNYYWQN